MANVRKLQNSFNGGIFSPKMYGRTDFFAYDSSVEELTNMVVWEQGGVSRRGGTRYVASCKTSTSTDNVRLIPFVRSATLQYMLEFGTNYMRVYTNRGQVYDGGTPYEIATPFDNSDIPNLYFDQSNDYLYIVDGVHAPQQLIRNSDTDWVLEEIDLHDGPYLERKDDLTITPSATTGTDITLTASADFFSSDMVGTFIRCKHGSDVWGCAKITAYTSPTSVTADVKEDFDSATASTEYREGSFSEKRGYPHVVQLMQQRLWFANHKDGPMRVWASKTSEFNNFQPGGDKIKTDLEKTQIVPSDPFTIAISGGTVTAIEWLVESKGAMVVGTTGAEYLLTDNGSPDGMTADTISAQRQTTEGSNGVPAEFVGDVTLFVTSTGRKLREFSYNFESDSYSTPNMLDRADHLTEFNTITDMTYMREPNKILWCVRNDGKLLGFTYDRMNKVTAWHYHELGGTDTKVESIAVMKSPDGTLYDLWLTVTRTINGTTVRYVEYLEHNRWLDKADNFFVDCGLTYDGAATNTVSGLDHLEGETVSILVDGSVSPNQTVTGGQVTFTNTYSKIHVGLPYASHLKTLRLEAGNEYTTQQGETKRVTKVVARVFDSLNGKTGPNLTTLTPIVSTGRTVMGSGKDLQTADIEVAFNSGYDTAGQIVIVQDQPLPMNVVAIILHGDIAP